MWPPEHERFADRADAGRALGAAVAAHLGTVEESVAPLILGVPRGGVPVAAEVAAATGGTFDLMLVRRLGLPWQADCAVGAIAEDSSPMFDHASLASYGIQVGDMAPAVARERSSLRRWREMYRDSRPAPDLAGRIVVIVDDGVHTGVIARAAVQAALDCGPSYLMFASPVCAAESVDWLTEHADAVVDLHSPREFPSLGLYYRDFPTLTDEQVTRMCAEAWQGAPVG